MTNLASPRILRSATDESGAAETNANSRQKSIKRFLDADGKECSIDKATQFSYTDIATGEKDVRDLAAIGAVAGSALAMLALFGISTLATNEASQVRQAAERGEEDVPSEVEGIADRLDQLFNDGIWREKREGGVGAAKVDRDALAQVVVDIAAQNGKTVDLLTIRQKLDDDTKFFRLVRKDERMTKLYNERVGKDSKPVDALAGL